MEAAAKHGDLAFVQRLHVHGAQSTPMVMTHAAANGHLNVERWLHEFRAEGCTGNAVTWAASNVHLDVIQWLHLYKPQQFTTEVMNKAAQEGQLKIVQWLHFNRT